MRIMIQVEALMLVLILAGGVRAAADLDPSNICTWLFAAGFVSLLICSMVLYARMEHLARSKQRGGSAGDGAQL